MPKSKLTLYLDENITRLAHKTAKLSGKSISTMVREYFLQKEREARSKEISPSVSKWIGILKTKKHYKKLRDEYVDSRLQKYENIN
jgi:hypothetical protein